MGRVWPTTYDAPSVNVDQSSEIVRGEQALHEVLHGLRVVDSCYCRTELSAPWALRMADCDAITFHFVAAGSAWLSGNGSRIRLAAGDLAVFPHGAAHRLEGVPDTPERWVLDLPIDPGEPADELHHGGGGEACLIICAGARFDPPEQPLAALLPELIDLRGDAGEDRELVGATLDAMRIESAARRPGGETVITRLCDILVISAVRKWLATSAEAQSGWVGALRDPSLGPALLAMHREPEHEWSVAELARTAHMSRATFAAHFSAEVGRTPLAYLTERRMELAAGLLREDGLSLGQVATRVGYGSVAAFSRAYKRTLGVSPGGERRRAAARRSP